MGQSENTETLIRIDFINAPNGHVRGRHLNNSAKKYVQLFQLFSHMLFSNKVIKSMNRPVSFLVYIKNLPVKAVFNTMRPRKHQRIHQLHLLITRTSTGRPQREAVNLRVSSAAFHGHGKGPAEPDAECNSTTSTFIGVGRHPALCQTTQNCSHQQSVCEA